MKKVSFILALFASTMAYGDGKYSWNRIGECGFRSGSGDGFTHFLHPHRSQPCMETEGFRIMWQEGLCAVKAARTKYIVYFTEAAYCMKYDSNTLLHLPLPVTATTGAVPPAYSIAGK